MKRIDDDYGSQIPERSRFQISQLDPQCAVGAAACPIVRIGLHEPRSDLYKLALSLIRVALSTCIAPDHPVAGLDEDVLDRVLRIGATVRFLVRAKAWTAAGCFLALERMQNRSRTKVTGLYDWVMTERQNRKP